MESNSSIKKPHFDLEILNKFDLFEENSNTKPVLLCNLSGAILYSNTAFCNLYKVNKCKNLVDLNTDPNLLDLIKKLSQKNINYFYGDLLIQNEDEYYKAYFLNLEKVKINNEDLFIIYFDSQDKRKNLSKKINIYNSALEYVSVGVMIADKNANVKYISTSFEKLFNVKIEDVYNKNLVSTFKKYLSLAEIIEMEFAITNLSKWVKVISDITNDGDVIYKEIKMDVIDDNIDRSTNFIITVNDITKHIQQTRIIKKSEQRQKSIINNISDPILIVKREKGEIYFENANNSFYSTILRKELPITNEIRLEIELPILYKIIKSSISQLDNVDKVHTQFHYKVDPNKQRFLGKISFIDDFYDNTRLYIINMSDITQQFKVEGKLREAYNKEISLNRLKSTFLANMSHEIRTPLNAIVGYSDLLEDEIKSINDESSVMLTDHLKEGVNRLLKLVDNIVEVSLLESGNEDVVFENININNVISENIDNWRLQAGLRNITIDVNLADEELIISASEEKLEKAIKEIVENAIKYNCDEGRIKISTLEIKNEFLVSVSDTGIGIEKDSIDKIFKLFEQEEDVSYTRKYEGAGLGLSLAHRLVTYMNGRLNISSKPNDGTIITISFSKSKKN